MTIVHVDTPAELLEVRYHRPCLIIPKRHSIMPPASYFLRTRAMPPVWQAFIAAVEVGSWMPHCSR